MWLGFMRIDGEKLSLLYETFHFRRGTYKEVKFCRAVVILPCAHWALPRRIPYQANANYKRMGGKAMRKCGKGFNADVAKTVWSHGTPATPWCA